MVDALTRDAGPDSAAVASSLTGAYALRSVVAGAPVRWLTLITPTGLGRPREEPDRVVEVISQLDRER